MSDAKIETAIFTLLAGRAPGATICPSDAARAVAGDSAFRALMDDVRRVAYALVDRGRLVITQKGTAVDGRAARGPIRLRLPE